MLTNGFWTSAIVFNFLSEISGWIVLWWLLLSTCCPIRPIHKKSLIALSVWAFILSGLTFLFYGNPFCKELGCRLTTGAWCQISSTILYLLTAGVLSGIKAKEAIWVLEQQQENRDEPKPNLVAAEEERQPEPTVLPEHVVVGIVMDAPK